MLLHPSSSFFILLHPSSCLLSFIHPDSWCSGQRCPGNTVFSQFMFLGLVLGMVDSAIQRSRILGSLGDFDTFYCRKCISSKTVGLSSSSLSVHMCFEIRSWYVALCIHNPPAPASPVLRLQVCIMMSFVSFEIKAENGKGANACPLGCRHGTCGYVLVMLMLWLQGWPAPSDSASSMWERAVSHVEILST